jgi:hypothetical protein
VIPKTDPATEKEQYQSIIILIIFTMQAARFLTLEGICTSSAQ